MHMGSWDRHTLQRDMGSVFLGSVALLGNPGRSLICILAKDCAATGRELCNRKEQRAGGTALRWEIPMH